MDDGVFIGVSCKCGCNVDKEDIRRLLSQVSTRRQQGVTWYVHLEGLTAKVEFAAIGIPIDECMRAVNDAAELLDMSVAPWTGA